MEKIRDTISTLDSRISEVEDEDLKQEMMDASEEIRDYIDELERLNNEVKDSAEKLGKIVY